MATAKQLIDAFRPLWNEDLKKFAEVISEKFSNDPEWTNYMVGNPKVGNPNSFLQRLARKLGYESALEWGKFDIVYYKGEDQNEKLFPRDRYGNYPNCLPVLIEHENRELVKFEMYKLLMYRSPLKVLIFYDWNDYEKKTQIIDVNGCRKV